AGRGLGHPRPDRHRRSVPRRHRHRRRAGRGRGPPGPARQRQAAERARMALPDLRGRRVQPLHLPRERPPRGLGEDAPDRPRLAPPAPPPPPPLQTPPPGAPPQSPPPPPRGPPPPPPPTPATPRIPSGRTVHQLRPDPLGAARAGVGVSRYRGVAIARRADMRDGLRIIDSDAHVIEPHSLWTDYLDPDLRDRAPRPVRLTFGFEFADFSVILPQQWSPDATPDEMQHMSDRIQATYAELFPAAYEQGFSAGAQLVDMDREGIDRAFLYPSFGLFVLASD